MRKCTISYSSCWGYSLINTLKLKKKRKMHHIMQYSHGISIRMTWRFCGAFWHIHTYVWHDALPCVSCSIHMRRILWRILAYPYVWHDIHMHVNTASHTWECVMSHVWICKISYVRMSHVTHVCMNYVSPITAMAIGLCAPPRDSQKSALQSCHVVNWVASSLSRIL